MNKKQEDFDPNKIAEELGLTDKQRLFCEYYLYLTGLDAIEAAKLAEYQVKYNENYSDAKREYYERLTYGGIATKLLNNEKILKYIKILREKMETSLVVDKLWVLQKLKTLADKGSENIQLKATELLGKSMEMFTEKTKVEGITDPAEIAKQAFEKRKNGALSVYKPEVEAVNE